MSQVSRQRDAQIQPNLGASAQDVAAELNHLIVGINDNDDRIVINTDYLADNLSSIVELQRGYVGLTTKDLSSVVPSELALTVADGQLVSLLVTSGNVDFAVGQADVYGTRIIYIMADSSTTETHWTLNSANVYGFGTSTQIPTNAILTLISDGVDVNWIPFVLSPEIEETFAMVTYTGYEVIPEVGTYDETQFVLDGTLVDTQTFPSGGWVTYDIDISGMAYGAILLRANFINTSTTTFTSRDYLVDHRHGFDLMTIGGVKIGSGGGGIEYIDFYAKGSRAPLTP